MKTQDIGHWNTQHSERIVVTQVLFYGKRQFYNVINALDVIRMNSVLIKSFLVKRRIVVGVRHYFFEFLTLQGAHLITRHTFQFLVPNHRCESVLCVLT